MCNTNHIKQQDHTNKTKIVWHSRKQKSQNLSKTTSEVERHMTRIREIGSCFTINQQKWKNRHLSHTTFLICLEAVASQATVSINDHNNEVNTVTWPSPDPAGRSLVAVDAGLGATSLSDFVCRGWYDLTPHADHAAPPRRRGVGLSAPTLAVAIGSGSPEQSATWWVND